MILVVNVFFLDVVVWLNRVKVFVLREIVLIMDIFFLKRDGLRVWLN